MKQILLTKSTLLTAASLVAVVTSDEYTHRYKKGDRVDLWVNKVRLYWRRCVFNFIGKKNDTIRGDDELY
jgi:HJR/Mrr/RecB family endonuclease